MHVFSEPSWFVGTDGKVHLVYELELTNGSPTSVTVTQVEVHDVATDAIIETLAGDALLSSTSLLASGANATTPAEAENDVTVSVPPGYPAPQTINNLGGRTPVRQVPPSVIGPPRTRSVARRWQLLRRGNRWVGPPPSLDATSDAPGLRC